MCESCGSAENLVADHDHALAEAKPRGVLCHDCNVALGFAHDRIDILQSLITYLESTKNARHIRYVKRPQRLIK